MDDSAVNDKVIYVVGLSPTAAQINQAVAFVDPGMVHV